MAVTVTHSSCNDGGWAHSSAGAAIAPWLHLRPPGVLSFVEIFEGGFFMFCVIS